MINNTPGISLQPECHYAGISEKHPQPPPSQLDSCSCQQPVQLHYTRQCLPPSPLPQSLLGNAHFPHTFPSIWSMCVILSMRGAPCPLLDWSSLSLLVLEDAMCGIWSQSQALTSGRSPALLPSRVLCQWTGVRGHPGGWGGQSGRFSWKPSLMLLPGPSGQGLFTEIP